MSIQRPKRDAVEALIDELADCTPEIRQILHGRRSSTDRVNESGDVQLEADVWADRLLEERLGGHPDVGQYASEEREDVIDVGGGPLSIAVDPLDGSSNLQSNNAMGTILAVYDAPLPARGRELIAAAYVLYGPITTMIVAVDGAVTEYEVVDGATHAIDEDVAIPEDPVVYGLGGRHPDWVPEFWGFAETVRRELKLRYGGALIADVNQVLTYGGVFAYPTLESRPEGKLRLQFEGNPIGYIVESAGGSSTDGRQSLLDVEPVELHQRVPLYVGNAEYVDRVERMLDGRRRAEPADD